MKILRLVFLLFFPLYLVSCGTQKKLPPYYLDHAIDTTIKAEVMMQELRIQKNDLLTIQVYSASTIAEADALYNLPLQPGEGANGFLVDANGNIEYPRLGTIHAEGLTKLELAAEIKKRLTEPVELLKNPSVIIRFQSYKFSVLGQVAREGVITVASEKVTILEAIALAGGITDYGKKSEVKLIRESNGKRQIGFIDLSSDSLFYSPYYHLVQNDVIIVNPNGRKEKDEDQAKAMQRISFALAIITVAATLYNIFK